MCGSGRACLAATLAPATAASACWSVAACRLRAAYAVMDMLQQLAGLHSRSLCCQACFRPFMHSSMDSARLHLSGAMGR